MKTRNIILFVFFINLTACNKLLDIKPKNVGVAEDVLRNTEQIRLLLNSAYDDLRSDEFMGGSVWLANELMADNLESGQLSDNFLALYNRNSTVFNYVSRQIWNHAYIIIYRSNLVLEALEIAPGIRPEDLANMRGQALFLRAFCHFQLVRLYAQPWGFTADNSHLGVPIRLKPEVSNLPRASVAQVYEQMLNDLNLAVQELPATQQAGAANVWAAKALMAEIFFQKNDFFFAQKYARDVVENAPYNFQSKIENRFLPLGSEEGILELVNEDPKSSLKNSGKILVDHYFSLGKQPLIYLNSGLVTVFKQNAQDLRLKKWVIEDTVTGNHFFYCSKFNDNQIFRVPVIHLTELKLIYAESAAELNELQRSAIQLNDIRKRVGLPNMPAISKTDLIADARAQRRLEMICEGNRLQDLKRMAVRDNAMYYVRKAPWNCNGLVLAIPDDEISANPLMVQNPTGGCL